MAQMTETNGEPLGVSLERQRLEHREARLEAVLRALHEDERGYRRFNQRIPDDLTRAVQDFERTRRAVQGRLHQLGL